MSIKSQTIASDGYITGIQRLSSDMWVTNTQHSLTSDMLISLPNSTIVCDGEILDDLMDEFGKPIMVRVVSKSVDNDDDYAQPVESYTDYSTTALVNVYSAIDEAVKEGVFKSGEVIFSLKPIDSAYAKPGNRILYGGKWYEISEVTEQPMQDIDYYLQIRVKKI